MPSERTALRGKAVAVGAPIGPPVPGKFVMGPGGCVQPAMPGDKGPFFKIDRFGNTVPLRARRMNVLNMKALNRANRRQEGFQRVVLRNFKCTSTGMKLTPKRGRVTRKRRKKK